MKSQDEKLVHRNHFRDRYGEHLTQDVFGQDRMEKLEVENFHVDHYKKVVYQNLSIAAIVLALICFLAMSVV